MIANGEMGLEKKHVILRTDQIIIEMFGFDG